MSDLSIADVAIFVLGKSVGALLRVATWLVFFALFVILALRRGRVRAALRTAALLAASIFAPALLPLRDPLLQSL
ncbi:hypothetical protein [Rhodobacter maris]|uniref:BlaR1 peptidase M56 n=1 Tax=Rhodobacter maris TaxID=446682 RepID=A0A285TKQ4_9RHOB|nr:hypothetical protein [Rhodobacter maris]SOC21266.1 hypothetical protein SAMN05877831_12213 [Rhodobacter maris]